MSTTKETTFKGQCYCSAIEFECVVPGDPAVIHCHCIGCRDWTGGIAYSALACSSVTFTKGTPKQFQRESGPVKSFCGDCGTGIMNNVVFGNIRHTVAAGIIKLDQDQPPLQTALHCQLAGKVPWADCSADGKPSFDKFP
jgi:hypothetical protein